MNAPVSAPLSAVRRAVGLAALTAWVGAGLRGGSSADDLTDAAARVGLRRIEAGGESLPVALAVAQLRADGLRVARLVLPAPGDVSGLPGPSSVNQRAISEAAAIILTTDEPTPATATVLMPSEDGQWPTYAVPLSPAVVATWQTVRQARAEFATGVAGHSEALTALDVAADARGLRDVVRQEDDQPLPPLPPPMADDRRELLGRARMVSLLAAAAATDDGAAVSAAEASSRAAHLRSLAGIARRAIAASVSGS